MIFISKNEDGELAWKLVKAGKKTVTRRIKPEPIGAIRAICPGRGKKAVCHVRVISCMSHWDWMSMYEHVPSALRAEAKREGFRTWKGLEAWFKMKYGGFPEGLYRIEFQIIK